MKRKQQQTRQKHRAMNNNITHINVYDDEDNNNYIWLRIAFVQHILYTYRPIGQVNCMCDFFFARCLLISIGCETNGNKYAMEYTQNEWKKNKSRIIAAQLLHCHHHHHHRKLHRNFIDYDIAFAFLMPLTSSSPTFLPLLVLCLFV